jgi:hypothetical protein
MLNADFARGAAAPHREPELLGQTVVVIGGSCQSAVRTTNLPSRSGRLPGRSARSLRVP